MLNHRLGAPTACRAVASARAPTGFVAWLRQTRRSAWVLIACCAIFRIVGAIVHDPAIAGDMPAIAGDRQ